MAALFDRETIPALLVGIMQEYDWRLLPIESLADHVLAQLGASSQPFEENLLRNLAINAYCALGLHPAWAGQCGDEARNRAFVELRLYFLKNVRRFWQWPDEASIEDVIQEACTDMAKPDKIVRQPAAILAVALQALRDAVKKVRRQETKSQGAMGLDEAEPPTHATAVESDVLMNYWRSQASERIEVLRAAHPRAQRQIDAAVLRHLHGFSTEEIADQLQTSPENASVLINRGMALFRNDPDLRMISRQILAT